MDISDGIKAFSLLGDGEGLHNTLGMEFFSTPDENTCMAKMKVDERHVQPFGCLNGGATAALAETLAGVGSLSLLHGRKCAGMSLTCNHLHPAVKGTTVTALARIVHKSGRIHVWNISITDEKGVAVSQITVTNFVLDDRK